MSQDVSSALFKADGTVKSLRDVQRDPGATAAVLSMLHTFARELDPRQRVLLEATVAAGDDARSLADMAREFGVSRVRTHAMFKQAIAALLRSAEGRSLDISDSTEIARAEPSLVDAVDRWARLTPESRRIEAVKAAHERDPERLWDVTQYVLATRGRKRAGMSPRTRAAYKRGIADLVEAWAHESLLKPSSDAGAMWLIRLETEPMTGRNGHTGMRRAASTVAVKLAAAKALYRALRHVGATDADPFRDLTAPADLQAPEDKREAYSTAEVGRLLAHGDVRDRALVLLCAGAGLRNAEACALTWSQVDRRDGLLRKVVGKGGRVRDVPASNDLLDALEATRPNVVQPEQTVLGFGPAQARQRLKRLCERSGVRYEGRGVHGLRHTAGTEVTRLHGIDAAADLLRHANLQTTRRYSKRSRQERRGVANDLSRGYDPDGGSSST